MPLSLHAWGCASLSPRLGLLLLPQSVLGLDSESRSSSSISCRDGLVARRNRSRASALSRSRNPRARVARWTSRRSVYVHRAAFSFKTSFPTTALCFDRSSYACDTTFPEYNVSCQEPLNLLPLASPNTPRRHPERSRSVSTPHDLLVRLIFWLVPCSSAASLHLRRTR